MSSEEINDLLETEGLKYGIVESLSRDVKDSGNNVWTLTDFGTWLVGNGIIDKFIEGDETTKRTIRDMFEVVK